MDRNNPPTGGRLTGRCSCTWQYRCWHCSCSRRLPSTTASCGLAEARRRIPRTPRRCRCHDFGIRPDCGSPDQAGQGSGSCQGRGGRISCLVSRRTCWTATSRFRLPPARPGRRTSACGWTSSATRPGATRCRCSSRAWAAWCRRVSGRRPPRRCSWERQRLPGAVRPSGQMAGEQEPGRGVQQIRRKDRRVTRSGRPVHSAD